MKISRLFAGVLIALLGVALILSNFDVLHFDWHYIFKLWPILLVVAGISVLVSNSKLRAVLYALTLVLVIVWVVSAASEGWRSVGGIFSGGTKNLRTQEFTQDFSKDVKHATFTLNSGAGSFTLNDTTSDLFQATSETNIGYYTFDSDKEGTSQNVSLRFEGKGEHWHFGGSRNTLDLKLNSKPVWDIDIDVGACSADFDLSPYVVHETTIKAGASSIKVRLGDKADTSSLKMDTGASKLTVYVPSNAGCRIRDDAELSSKSFDGFTKGDDGNYRSPNYDSAKKKIFIDVEAGVSSIKVVQY